MVSSPEGVILFFTIFMFFTVQMASILGQATILKNVPEFTPPPRVEGILAIPAYIISNMVIFFELMFLSTEFQILGIILAGFGVTLLYIIIKALPFT